jgi:glutaryl-CoA dehydrogenase
MRGPLSCLTKARYGIAWGAIGAALDCYDTALRYSKERIQFGKPIGGFQLTQKKLAEMITEITKAQLLTWRLGTLANAGKMTPAQVVDGQTQQRAHGPDRRPRSAARFTAAWASPTNTRSCAT